MTRGTGAHARWVAVWRPAFEAREIAMAAAKTEEQRVAAHAAYRAATTDARRAYQAERRAEKDAAAKAATRAAKRTAKAAA